MSKIGQHASSALSRPFFEISLMAPEKTNIVQVAIAVVPVLVYNFAEMFYTKLATQLTRNKSKEYNP